MSRDFKTILLVTIAAGCLAGGLALKLKTKKTAQLKVEEIETQLQIKSTDSIHKIEKALTETQNKNSQQATPKVESKQNQNKLSEKEQTSVESLVKVLFAARGVQLKASDFAKTLENIGLEPKVKLDSNKDTGDLSIVRTNKTLEGTRYLHAQFFSDEKGKSSLQHLSFEVRPSENSFAVASEIVKTQFGKDIHLTTNEAELKTWSTKDGYVVWIKKMTAEDLQGNPFNSYSQKDIGTIRVVIEENVHGTESFGGD